MKKVILEEIENMKYLLGYKRGVVISEQQVGNQKFNFNDNPALNQGGINYTPSAPADMFKNAQAAVASATPATGKPATPAAQKFNFNPNPNITPENGINFKMQTPQDLAKGVASATPAAGATTPPASTAPVTPIKIGVKYPSIEELQNTLKTKFQADLTPDGKYGPKTAASVLAALQKASTNTSQTNTPETNTPPNIVVGGDPNAEAIKKAAEANAPNNVAANNTNNNTQQPAGGTNYAEVDGSEFS